MGLASWSDVLGEGGRDHTSPWGALLSMAMLLPFPLTDYVSQVGLKLPGSSNPPALAS